LFDARVRVRVCYIKLTLKIFGDKAENLSVFDTRNYRDCP